jgi:hypothetical protein
MIQCPRCGLGFNCEDFEGTLMGEGDGKDWVEIGVWCDTCDDWVLFVRIGPEDWRDSETGGSDGSVSEVR